MCHSSPREEYYVIGMGGEQPKREFPFTDLARISFRSQ
jgi:hypothetical protein